MTDALDNLQSMPLDDVPSFYAEPAEAARDIEIGLEGDRLMIRRPTRRRAFNAMHVANLAKTLERLPAAGETWHIICRGNWPAWSLVPRTLELITPAKISWLGIATLGFSRDNVDELMQMLDAGDISRCSLLYSCYFRSNEETLTGFLMHEMQRRGQRINAIRTHAKIIAMHTDDGRDFVVGVVGNLRSCRNVEQFTISHDAGLLNFHREWIETLAAGASS